MALAVPQKEHAMYLKRTYDDNDFGCLREIDPASKEGQQLSEERDEAYLSFIQWLLDERSHVVGAQISRLMPDVFLHAHDVLMLFEFWLSTDLLRRHQRLYNLLSEWATREGREPCVCDEWEREEWESERPQPAEEGAPPPVVPPPAPQGREKQRSRVQSHQLQMFDA
jgi:hypothetical protein